MILAIDIGNSDIVWGIYRAGQWLPEWRHPSSDYLKVEETLKKKIEETEVDFSQLSRVVLSSVVPGITPFMLDVIRRYTQRDPLLMGPDLYQQMELEIDNPWEIGSDLVANALAGYELTKDYCVVIDFGTALTFTCVSDTGYVLGVSIAPGLKTAMNALFYNTAQLPQVPLEIPPNSLGKNTAHALQSGIMLGYVGLVKELLARFREDIGHDFKVLATGGLARFMTPLHSYFDMMDPMLTLDGLRLVAERA
ncbi:MAG: type III pantothenate kinase [Bacteroidia bacterium]|nr:type III pantothenate kinase [Bacteroidia bacterium]